MSFIRFYFSYKTMVPILLALTNPTCIIFARLFPLEALPSDRLGRTPNEVLLGA